MASPLFIQCLPLHIFQTTRLTFKDEIRSSAKFPHSHVDPAIPGPFFPPFIPQTHTCRCHSYAPLRMGEPLPPFLFAPHPPHSTLIRLFDEVPPRRGRIINVRSRTGSTQSCRRWLSAERSGRDVPARPPCLFHSSVRPADEGRVNL